MLEVVRATLSDIESIVPLFDAYRVFYERASNENAAKSFIEERLSKGESIIFLANWEENAVGFTQLYTTYSSVSLESFYILNDLFVLPRFRGKGIGELLLNKAKEYCLAKGFKGVALETAKDNPAQHLYEKLGWKKDTEFFHYFWTSPNTKA